MLKTKKKLLLEAIEESNFDKNLFKGIDAEGTATSDFVIKLKNSPLDFSVLTFQDNFDAHATVQTRFDPKFTKGRFPHGNYYSPDWDKVTGALNSWLQSHVGRYLQELDTPDVWRNIDDPQSFTLGGIPQPEEDHFQAHEIAEIRLLLESYRSDISKELKEIHEELSLEFKQFTQHFDSRIDYLSKALDRLNRFDWKALFINLTGGLFITFFVESSCFDMIKDSISSVHRQMWEDISQVIPNSPPDQPLLFENPGLSLRREDENK